MAKPLIWIGYTTKYREGGGQLELAARTIAREQEGAHPECEVRLRAVETKAEFRQEMGGACERGQLIRKLHLVVHGGMYGPMFGTRAHPEQLSPHEWRTLEVPFADDGEAFFAACRSARWFAPFFARTFGVPAHGFHWYTTFSLEQDRFRWRHPLAAQESLYVFGCEGKKSHGWLGVARKYAGLTKPEMMKRFEPEAKVDASYDSVSELYGEVFADIRVRKHEWAWLSAQLDEMQGSPRVLDIGCGNGALLRQLAPRIHSGVGVDASAGMLAQATTASADFGSLRFAQVSGPSLPVEDASADVVISLMSFRYLDWDPIVDEVRRVLRAGGRFLVIDMVASPPQLRGVPCMLVHKLREQVTQRANPGFRAALQRMVGDPRWRKMLQYNPIRAEHEMRWYLPSRFPGGVTEVLNIGLHSKVMAFDSGPV